MRFGDFIALIILWTLLALFIVEFQSRVSNAEIPTMSSMTMALVAQNKVTDALDRKDFAQACAAQRESNNMLSALGTMPDLIIKGRIMEKLICELAKQKQGEVI